MNSRQLFLKKNKIFSWWNWRQIQLELPIRISLAESLILIKIFSNYRELGQDFHIDPIHNFHVKAANFLNTMKTISTIKPATLETETRNLENHPHRKYSNSLNLNVQSINLQQSNKWRWSRLELKNKTNKTKINKYKNRNRSLMKM